jgi:branched-chain amino acid transport system ATP-binding protein
MTGLVIADLAVHFGGVRALDGVSLEIPAGGVHALIGPNGAGKTTLINAITGRYRPTAGRVTLDGRDLTGWPAHRLARHGLSRTFQNLQVFSTMTVLENVLAGFHLAHQAGFWRGLLRAPGLVHREGHLVAEAHRLLDAVGLGARADAEAASLAYGEQKRLEIARALAARPRLLFLDEPVAGCTPPEKQALGQVIRGVADRGDTTVVLVEHDMRLVMAVSDLVTVLVRGQVLAQDRPGRIRHDPAVVSAYLGPTRERCHEAVD